MARRAPQLPAARSRAQELRGEAEAQVELLSERLDEEVQLHVAPDGLELLVTSSISDPVGTQEQVFPTYQVTFTSAFTCKDAQLIDIEEYFFDLRGGSRAHQEAYI